MRRFNYTVLNERSYGRHLANPYLKQIQAYTSMGKAKKYLASLGISLYDLADDICKIIDEYLRTHRIGNCTLIHMYGPEYGDEPETARFVSLEEICGYIDQLLPQYGIPQDLIGTNDGLIFINKSNIDLWEYFCMEVGLLGKYLEDHGYKLLECPEDYYMIRGSGRRIKGLGGVINDISEI